MIVSERRSGFSRELFSIGRVFIAANNANDAKLLKFVCAFRAIRG
jgi:hypothetical protein